MTLIRQYLSKFPKHRVLYCKDYVFFQVLTLQPLDRFFIELLVNVQVINESILVLPVILEKPIRIPRSLSVKAASILKGYLNKVNYHKIL